MNKSRQTKQTYKNAKTSRLLKLMHTYVRLIWTRTMRLMFYFVVLLYGFTEKRARKSYSAVMECARANGMCEEI